MQMFSIGGKGYSPSISLKSAHEKRCTKVLVFRRVVDNNLYIVSKTVAPSLISSFFTCINLEEGVTVELPGDDIVRPVRVALEILEEDDL